MGRRWRRGRAMRNEHEDGTRRVGAAKLVLPLSYPGPSRPISRRFPRDVSRCADPLIRADPTKDRESFSRSLPIEDTAESNKAWNTHAFSRNAKRTRADDKRDPSNERKSAVLSARSRRKRSFESANIGRKCSTIISFQFRMSN